MLPAFGQQASAADQRQLDALPISQLREHVLLGSASVQPDPTGIVCDMPIGTFNSNRCGGNRRCALPDIPALDPQ
ncbi:hypothetical protein [Qipengyuania sp. MTN3-11]|uniref:hypothetical protein n=1 Tax=Qipengyuania sp. MTN3-11 TaxID=3056557 RepID=UPI0036F4253D